MFWVLQIRPGLNGSTAPFGRYNALWISFYRAEYSTGQGDSSVNYFDIGMIRVLFTALVSLPYHSYLGYKYDCSTVSCEAKRNLC